MNKLDIEGVIGWDVTASSVKRALAEFDESEDLLATLNSPGGYIDDGFSIYTALKNRPGNVHIHITGIAASMGSVIAMAGDIVTMEETGLAMIHPPSSIAWGTAVDMRKQADVLDKYESRIVTAYERRTLKLSSEELANAIAEETWYTAQEFLAAGFIDEVRDGEPAASTTQNRASVEWLRVAQYKNIPKAASQFFKTNGPPLKNIQFVENNFQGAKQGLTDMTEEQKQKLLADNAAAVNARWAACMAVGASAELTQKIASNMAFDDAAAVDMLNHLKASTAPPAPAPETPVAPAAAAATAAPTDPGAAALALVGHMQSLLSGDVNAIPNNPEDRREAEAKAAEKQANAQAKETEAFADRMAKMAARTGYKNPAPVKPKEGAV